MTDQDLPQFLDIYRNLLRVFPMRQSDGESRSQEAAYFKSLRYLSLADVTAAAEVLIATTTHFPKPIEWKRAVPARESVDVRVMRDAEAREYQRAVSRNWEDDPCSCAACSAAGVTHRFLRFVPESDPETGIDDRAYNPMSKRVVVPGRWIHGDDLRRWYVARDHFFALQAKYGVKAMPALSQPQRNVLRDSESGDRV